jgi:CTP:molybdopterin cytidylyltransferase MocA
LVISCSFTSIDGKNVAELRDATGVKAGVSKVVQGVHDRVLTVVGSLESVAKVSHQEGKFGWYSIRGQETNQALSLSSLGLRLDCSNAAR